MYPLLLYASRLSAVHDMILAGIAEHCVFFPLDSVKTRLQSLCPCPETRCPTPIHGVASMVRREGWLRPLRGVNAVAAGSAPAHALYFTVYEKTKVRNRIANSELAGRNY